MDREPIPQSTTTLTPSVSQSNNHSHHANSSPSNGFRNNEVRTVMLYRVPIIALVMDGQERLCLAQISNTLLKNFSYNEIHNRRVALGITCVQCTPVQLELLRRAGAMPVSSRRCGMITKREAERLCKSFLAETAPPKLPDSFSFDIYHQCAWGCRGSFTPSRYNSSRAKCIKCIYCGLFFSPNKFIFHSHRLPDSKYVQPDAANFNSWRRHIKLIGSPEPPDDVIYAWEARKLEALIIDVIQIDFLYELTLLKDVKAMFNGGSRKRAMTASLNSCSRSSNVSHQEIIKRQRLNSSSPESSQSLTPNTTISDSLSPKSTTSGGPTYFPLIPLPNKCYSLPSTTPFTANTSIQSSPMKALSSGNAADFRQSFAEFMWVGSGKPPALHIPYSCLLWPRPPSLASSIDFATPESNRNKLLFCSNDTNSLLFPHQQQRDNHQHWSHINQTIDSNNNTQMHTSAFKPVAKSSLNSVIDLDQPNNTSPKNDTITRSPSPSARLSHTSDDNDAEVDIIGEDGDESTFFAKRENNLLLFENEKQMLANRKNKSYSISESESNAVTDKKRFESVSREDMNLNFVGQFFDKIEGSNERKYKSPLNNVCSTALDLRNLSSLSRGNYFSV